MNQIIHILVRSIPHISYRININLRQSPYWKIKGFIISMLYAICLNFHITNRFYPIHNVCIMIRASVN